MRFLARFFAIFFLLTTSYLLLTTDVAHAQYSNPYANPNTDANVPANLHTYTQSVILEVLDGFTCQIMGFDPATSSHQCLGFDSSTGKIGYVPSNGGVVGFASNMIAALYTPPLHTADYVNYMASNFGLVKRTYAVQKVDGTGSSSGTSVSSANNGIGFDKLTPLLGLWTTFRNISYLAFIIIFIAIGFAIMLRVKIDPRTVMTIENQIPKIIIGLLLVTFSYAIAGFLIDTMYVATYLTVNVITSSQAVNSSTAYQIHNAERSDLAGGNPFGFANDAIPGGIIGISAGAAGSAGDIIRNEFNPDAQQQHGLSPSNDVICNKTDNIAPVNWIGNGFCNLGKGIGDAIAGAVGFIVSWVVSILAFLIIAIAILIALFRVWFSLLLAYVSILLDVILAPFFIIAGVFPGSKIGFGAWLRDIGSNLLAFPVTVGMFLLAGVFMDSFSTNSTNIFVPPLIGNPQGNSTGQSPIAYIIAVGFVLMTPSVVGLMRGLLKAPQNKALQSIGQGLLTGASPLGLGVKSIVAYNQHDLMGKRMKFRGVLQTLGL